MGYEGVGTGGGSFMIALVSDNGLAPLSQFSYHSEDLANWTTEWNVVGNAQDIGGYLGLSLWADTGAKIGRKAMSASALDVGTYMTANFSNDFIINCVLNYLVSATNSILRISFAESTLNQLLSYDDIIDGRGVQLRVENQNLYLITNDGTSSTRTDLSSTIPVGSWTALRIEKLGSNIKVYNNQNVCSPTITQNVPASDALTFTSLSLDNAGSEASAKFYVKSFVWKREW